MVIWNESGREREPVGYDMKDLQRHRLGLGHYD